MTGRKTSIKEDKSIGELLREAQNLHKIVEELRDASEINIPEFQGI